MFMIRRNINIFSPPSDFNSSIPSLKSSHSLIMVAIDVAPARAVVPAAVPCKDQIIAVDHLMEGRPYMPVRDFPNAAAESLV